MKPLYFTSTSSIRILLSVVLGLALTNLVPSSTMHATANDEELEVRVFTDTEGKWERFQDLINSGDIIVEQGPDGPKYKIREGLRIVFNGDMFDHAPAEAWGRGNWINVDGIVHGVNTWPTNVDDIPASIRLSEIMLKLKTEYPDRFVMIQGNRDVNKLGVYQAYEQARRKGTGFAPYRMYLEKLYAKELEQVRGETAINTRLAQLNTPEAQVRYAISAFLGDRAFFYHVSEYAHLKGIPDLNKVPKEELVKLQTEAALDYIERIGASGSFFQVIRRGRLMDRYANMIHVHGGIDNDSFLWTPNTIERAYSIDNWGNDLDRFTATLDLFHIDPFSSEANSYVSFGDAAWSDVTQMAHSYDKSIVYGTRILSKDGIHGLPPPTVRQELMKEGVNTMVVGHTPQVFPTILQSDDGFYMVYADTSFSPFIRDVNVRVQAGRTPSLTFKAEIDGEIRQYTANPGQDRFIGKIIDFQGRQYKITGVDDEGNYLVYRGKRGDRRNIRFLTRNQLEFLEKRNRIRTAEYFDRNIEEQQYFRPVRENIESRGHDVVDLEAVSEHPDFHGRRPIMVSGWVSSDSILAPEVLERQLDAAIGGVKDQDIFLISGGSKGGTDAITEKIARKYNIPILYVGAKVGNFEGLIQPPEGVRGIYTFPCQTYNCSAMRAAELVAEMKGTVIGAGGQTVANDLLKASVALGSDVRILPGHGGASDLMLERAEKVNAGNVIAIDPDMPRLSHFPIGYTFDSRNLNCDPSQVLRSLVVGNQ